MFLAKNAEKVVANVFCGFEEDGRLNPKGLLCAYYVPGRDQTYYNIQNAFCDNQEKPGKVMCESAYEARWLAKME